MSIILPFKGVCLFGDGLPIEKGVRVVKYYKLTCIYHRIIIGLKGVKNGMVNLGCFEP